MAEVYITLDIETLPDMREGAADAARSRISAPSNYKDPVKIEAYIAEKGEEAWRRTALDGGYGEVLCIGYAVNAYPGRVMYRNLELEPHEQERDLLERFWRIIRGFEPVVGDICFIGNRVAAFDLRFLWRRSVIHGVRPSLDLPLNDGPWSDRVADLSYMWTGERSGGISLDTLADIFGVETGDTGLSGAHVFDAFERGEHERIQVYCLGDVEVSRGLYNAMTFDSILRLAKDAWE